MHKNKTEETAVDHLEFNEMFRRNEAIVYNFIRYRILDKSLAHRMSCKKHSTWRTRSGIF